MRSIIVSSGGCDNLSVNFEEKSKGAGTPCGVGWHVQGVKGHGRSQAGMDGALALLLESYLRLFSVGRSPPSSPLRLALHAICGLAWFSHAIFWPWSVALFVFLPLQRSRRPGWPRGVNVEA
jgi:hypothetical protein